MSEEQALRFLQAVREDPSVRELVKNRQDELTQNDLIAIGAELGWCFDANDLAQAFRHEWTIRWMHARSKRHPPSNET